MQGRNDSVDSPDGKKGLFEDFSFSTVIASGLAAATSFALASQIGIAGSIIGTLIGGFASAAASQVYRSLLSASADKLRQVGPASGEAAATGRRNDSAAPRDADATVAAAADPTRTIFRRPAVGLGAVEEVAKSGTPIAPAAARAAARAAEHRRQRRRATAVAAAVSIAAVLVFALVVGFVTQGRGIGTKPSAPATQEQPQVSGQVQTTATEGEPKADAGAVAKKDDASGTVSSTTEGDGQQKTDSAQGTTGTGDSASQGTGASGGAGTGTGAGGASSGTGNTSSSEGTGSTSGGSTSSSTGAGTATDGGAGNGTGAAATN